MYFCCSTNNCIKLGIVYTTGSVISFRLIIVGCCCCCCCRRKKLKVISVKELDDKLSSSTNDSDALRDVLIAVCVLADWNPVCSRLENSQLQAAQYELQQQAAAGSSGSDATHIQVGPSEEQQTDTLQMTVCALL